jgi:hypothetical protein
VPARRIGADLVRHQCVSRAGHSSATCQLLSCRCTPVPALCARNDIATNKLRSSRRFGSYVLRSEHSGDYAGGPSCASASKSKTIPLHERYFGESYAARRLSRPSKRRRVFTLADHVRRRYRACRRRPLDAARLLRLRRPQRSHDSLVARADRHVGSVHPTREQRAIVRIPLQTLLSSKRISRVLRTCAVKRRSSVILAIAIEQAIQLGS